MQRRLEQHPTPPALADAVVALAVRLFGASTQLWLEPCCGAGALLHRLPRPRLGNEIDATLVAQHPAGEDVRCGDCMALTGLGVARDAVCVVTNPPFHRTTTAADSNQTGGERHWLRAFLTHMATLGACGVFVMPAGLVGHRWWRETLAAQPELLLHYEAHRRVRFENARAPLNVVVVALRLPAEWAAPRLTAEQMDALRAAVAPDMQVVDNDDPAGNAVVRIWASPKQLGSFSLDPAHVRATRERLPTHLRRGRSNATHIFLRVHKPENAERRLRHMRAVVAARYAQVPAVSVFLSLGELMEACRDA